MNHMNKLLSYHDSPDFQATVARERQEILAELKVEQQNSLATRPSTFQSSIPHIPTTEDKPNKRQIAAAEAKAKSKMRPLDHPNISEAPTPSVSKSRTPPESSPTTQTLLTPKKASSLTTLRLLFPSPASDARGTIQWIDFVTTMAELGFQGEHRGGSEWTFRYHRKGEDSKRSIVLHQPHPEQKMGPIYLQQIGKRLWRRFGWEREGRCLRGVEFGLIGIDG